MRPFNEFNCAQYEKRKASIDEQWRFMRMKKSQLSYENTIKDILTNERSRVKYLPETPPK